MPRTYSVAVLAFLAVGASALPSAHAQTTKPAVPAVANSGVATPQKLPRDVVDYFSGKWSGQGEFASGKKIEADIEFHDDLDGQWLAYRHTDRPPGRYKAFGMWGFERSSNAFVMTLNDNFGGTRNFSSTGWQGGRIAFERAVEQPAQSPSTSQKRERFTFLRETDDRMKMVYEVNADGSQWKMVDYLIFVRR